MPLLIDLIRESPEYRELLYEISSGKKAASVYGMSPIHQAHFAAALRLEFSRPILVVARDERAAEALAADYAGSLHSLYSVLCIG